LALFATAWYLLHPANAETINYVSARSDSLSTFFLLLGLVLYGYSRVARRTYLYLVPAALGILAKAQAAVFAPLLLLYTLFEPDSVAEPGSSGGRHRGAAAVVKHVVPSLVVCGLLLAFVDRMTPDTYVPGGASLYRYVITQPYVILRYFRVFFLPVDLSADTDWEAFSTILDDRALAGITFVLILLAAACAFSRGPRTRPIAFGLFWFLVALVPTSFVLPLAEVTNDHRMFLPFVGLALAAAAALSAAAQSLQKAVCMPVRAAGAAAGLAACMLLSACALGTHRRNEVWDNDESLWRDVTVKSPGNGRGLMNYGLAKMAKGEYAEAEKYYLRALEYAPDYPYLHVNLGVLREAMGRPEEAERHFRDAVAKGAGYPATHFYYARFLRNRGRGDEALDRLEQALRLSPADMRTRHLMMDLLQETGARDRLHDFARATLDLCPGDSEAMRHLDAGARALVGVRTAADAVNVNPTHDNYLQLSLMLYRAGRFKESVNAAREAVRLRPDSDAAYNNICAAWNRLEAWDLAIEAGEAAVRLNPDNELARNNLAEARVRFRESDR
jgi:tetratricopeptide (TPR) repeat protein